jgi:hypothetical protein
VLLSQLAQCIVYLDVQGPRQFIGAITAPGTIDEPFGGGQQRAKTREPDIGMRPQSTVVKTGDFAQSIVSAAMGITGEVTEWFELAEDGDIDRGTQGLLHVIEGGGLVAQQKRAQLIGAKGKGSHNVIVPATTIPPDRNYNEASSSLATSSEEPEVTIST